MNQIKRRIQVFAKQIYFPGPHLMILVLHLPTMTLRNFRKDIELSSQEHDMYKESKYLSMDVSLILLFSCYSC